MTREQWELASWIATTVGAAITAVGALVTAIGVCLVIWQLYMQRKEARLAALDSLFSQLDSHEARLARKAIYDADPQKLTLKHLHHPDNAELCRHVENTLATLERMAYKIVMRQVPSEDAFNLYGGVLLAVANKAWSYIEDRREMRRENPLAHKLIYRRYFEEVIKEWVPRYCRKVNKEPPPRRLGTKEMLEWIFKPPELQKPSPILCREIRKTRLQSASPEDQALFLTIAHVANEMNALLRAAVWSSDFDSAVQAEVDGQRTLTLMFLELLAGKLNEAHDVIKGAYFGSALSKAYAARLKPGGQKALEEIMRYFSRNDNNVDRIRNNFAFHYSKDMRGMLPQILASVSECLVSYMQRHGAANNLYYFAEVVAAEALFQAIGIPNNPRALSDLSKELIDIARNFAVLFDDLMGTFLESLGQEAWHAPAEPVSFDHLPFFDDIRIPWFTDTTNLTPSPT